MKLGFGLYRHMLDDEHCRFAKQCGATHVVVHLVDYFRRDDAAARGDQPVGDLHGWGRAGDPDRLWGAEELAEVRRLLDRHGLVWAAVENLDPAHWYDVLLDGPRKLQQIEHVKTIVRRLGAAGVPVLGYNFSLAGVAGRIKGPFARGGAEAVGMAGPVDDPIPNGMVWNMVYDPDAPPGCLAPVTAAQLWERFAWFLTEMLPVAEEAGVDLALHPDDPPLAMVRGQPRLVWRPELYQRLAAINPSPRNRMEFCVGTVAEMAGGDVYQPLERHCREGRVAYVHLRNVRGKAPFYQETFLDEGDVDAERVLRVLHQSGFDGVVIPDHAPQMTCAAPWHAGMAFTMGYLKALIARTTRSKRR
jgi:mannonate dehydratase